MRIAERLGLAHLAYRRAVLRARAEPTPASWRQLVTAGRNLRGARRDQARSQRRGASVPAPAVAGVLVRLPLRPRASPGSELARECERARELMARARALVAQSCALRAEVAALSRSWRGARVRYVPGR